MISSKKIKIYSKYQGNIDDWARSVSRREYKVLSDEDWFLIEELIQNLEVIEKGLTSEDFKDKVLKKLQKNCDSLETQEKLKNLIGKYR